MKWNSRRKQRGLIELIVVILIIVILAAVAFPVFRRAQERAREHDEERNGHRASQLSQSGEIATKPTTVSERTIIRNTLAVYPYLSLVSFPAAYLAAIT